MCDLCIVDVDVVFGVEFVYELFECGCEVEIVEY